MLRLRRRARPSFSPPTTWSRWRRFATISPLIHKSEVVLQGRVYDIRNEHRPGIFRFRLYGNGFDRAPLFTLLSKETYHEFIDLRIRKTENISSNELAKLIFDRYEVVSYDEELPTMNDVFIQTVSQLFFFLLEKLIIFSSESIAQTYEHT